jgi:hypothetical protein
LSIIGLFLGLLYILRVWSGEPQKEKDYDEDLAEKISQLKMTNQLLETILKDYENSNTENQKRDNITLLIGSILVTASLLVLASTVSEKLVRPIGFYALISIGLYSLWLFILHTTSKELDRITYYRIKAIEKGLSRHFGYQFGIHSYISEKTQKKLNDNTKTYLWLRRRRIFWGIIWLLLSFSWMLLSL